MDQDWKEVIIRGKHAVKETAQKKEIVITQKKFNSGKNVQIGKNDSNLEKKMDDDSYELPKVSLNTKIQIQQERQKKGWTRKELAQKCNLSESTIRDYELGVIVPNQNELSKMRKVLGVNFKK